MSYVVKPIGIIRSPFHSQAGTPIQPIYSKAKGEVEIFEEFEAGLKDIELFSHIFLIYWFHCINSWKPLVIPFRDTELRGIFATRAPLRPNPIGISAVSLIKRSGRILQIKGVDVVNGTPLLDVKPFAPEFDNRPHASSGWLPRGIQAQRADSRFAKNQAESPFL